MPITVGNDAHVAQSPLRAIDRDHDALTRKVAAPNRILTIPLQNEMVREWTTELEI
jgi:hypothetical protein